MIVSLTAKYAGQCRCGAEVHRGDSIRYDRRARAVVECRSCRDMRAEGHLADSFDRAYEDQCARDCGLDSLYPFDR